MTPSLTPEELAWLATLDDVESRLVFTERGPEDTDYRVEEGPFDHDRLANLPDRDWTLLVQDVEKHLPDFRTLLSQIEFIPDWRIDDVMISFAAPGGSVGPHEDNYDVFLCQVSGQREWRIGSPGQAIRPAHSGQLSLLQPFSDPDARILGEGDVLYLPPGVPHWGIAKSACMTCSIGMRAPTLHELHCVYEREFPDSAEPFDKTDSDHTVFYMDPDLRSAESSAGRISQRAVDRLRKQLPANSTLCDIELATMLGCAATELKPWLVPEPPCSEDLVRIAELNPASCSPPVHGMARIAWWADGDQALVFANGHGRREPPENMAFFEKLCTQRLLVTDSMRCRESEQLIDWLLDAGVFDLHSEHDLPIP